MNPAFEKEDIELMSRAPEGVAADHIDLGDLVSLLLGATEPDRELDQIVGTMLGGKYTLPRASKAHIRAGLWLMDQVPAYTAGGSALSTLSHRRGYVCEHYFDGVYHHVETRRPSTGEKIAIKNRFQGIAGIVGIAYLEAKRLKNA